MKKLSALLCVVMVLVMVGQAQAAKKRKRSSHHRGTVPTQTAPSSQGAATRSSSAPADDKGDDQSEQGEAHDQKASLNFDFFGDGKGGSAGDKPAGLAGLSAEEAEAESHTRRWMLKTHQTLGITTWALLASTCIVGQLNYNQLWGGGGGSTKWQTPHRILVLTTSLSFAATGAFALFAPNPYPKPLHFDTGLVHRIAVIGATLGMITEGVLGWVTTHQADAGNPNRLRSTARLHQIVGYSTLGFLTIAGTVWVF
jgi:hypothetical protein